MKQQLRSMLRTFCFLVKIVEVMNDHQDICRNGRWELWAWHLGSCTVHGQEQRIENSCVSVCWHQLSPRMRDSLLEVTAKCHTQFLEVATLQEDIHSLFSCQGSEKNPMKETCFLWHKRKCVNLWALLKLKHRTSFCNTQILLNCRITEVCTFPYYFIQIS